MGFTLSFFQNPIEFKLFSKNPTKSTIFNFQTPIFSLIKFEELVPTSIGVRWFGLAMTQISGRNIYLR